MDITKVFKSYVKNVKLQRSLLMDADTLPSLKFKSKRDEFNSKSKDIMYHISKLNTYLLEHKQQYINVNSFSSVGASITDVEREKIDCAARNIIKNCSTLLKELTVFIEKNSLPGQLYEHRKGVLEIVENYLKSVCKIYSDIRECYGKRQTEYNTMMKVMSKESEEKPMRPKDMNSNNYNQDMEESVNNHLNSVVEELTTEELQMFEVENADLIDELNNLRSEVKAIEQKVTHIAGLQNTFTEVVLQQDLDIQRIDTKLIGTTENVQDANLELRKAVQNNASFRFYLLFFILMVSFTLLFLNWYND
ncbi:hypothetical protein PGB90_004483 [Kerria lacca]